MTHCRLKPRIVCPFAPFFELARRVARPVTFTRLSQRERASGVAEAEKRVYKCICDRIALRVAPSTSDGRRRIVKCVRRAEVISTTVVAFSHTQAGVVVYT